MGEKPTSRKHSLTAPTVVGIICCVLLVASTVFPAFHVTGDPARFQGHRTGTYYGWALLLLGWYGAIAGVGWWGLLGWLANPFWLLATVNMMARKHRFALACGAAAVALAMASFALHEISLGDLLPGGTIDEYGAGFLLWFSAIGLSFAAPAYFLASASTFTNDNLKQRKSDDEHFETY